MPGDETVFWQIRVKFIKPSQMRLALYQPDIPQNLGSLMRLSACLDVPLEVIEPCGFTLDDRRIRRAAMDYYDHTRLTRHASWRAFLAWRASRTPPGRLALLTTRADGAYTDFAFTPHDILLLGQESSGVPEAVRREADALLRIPISPRVRSLNVALAAAMALGEALRQTAAFPAERAA